MADEGSPPFNSPLQTIQTGFWGQTWFFPVYWVLLALLFLIGDYFAGPIIQFPILFLIPVGLASWFNGKWWGLTFAVVLPIIRLYFYVGAWTVPFEFFDIGLNALIRILVLGAFALLTDRTADQNRKLSLRVRVLEGFLPVCSFCKKIRNQEGDWHSMEKFITERSEAQFTHGICPECKVQHYGKYLHSPSSPIQSQP